jgi:hypothetical protein
MGNFKSLTVRQFDDDINREPTEQELRDVPAMTREECRDVFRSKEYKESHLVRKLTHAAMGKSDRSIRTTAQPEEKTVDIGNSYEAKKAAARKLFADPRYKHDAQYRYEVVQKLKAFQATDAPPEGKTNRVQISAHPSNAVDRLGFGATRIQFDAKTTGMHKSEPVEREPKKSDDTIDLGY